jgi:hypothetical protein
MAIIDSYNGNGLRLGAYVNSILQQNNLAYGVARAPHANFWDSLSYREFTTGDVPGLKNFGPMSSYRILVTGDGTNSNFVLALQGIGPLFDDITGVFGRMPPNAVPPGRPFFTDAQIDPIIHWINRGCPNPGGA